MTAADRERAVWCKAFAVRKLGPPRSICGKPQRIAALWHTRVVHSVEGVCNLGGNTDSFVPYERVLFFLRQYRKIIRKEKVTDI